MSDEVLAPSITRVLDAAQQLVAALLGRSRRAPEDVQPALELACEAAARYLEDTRALLVRLEATLDPSLRTAVSGEIERAFSESRAALGAIGSAAAAGNLSVLQSAIDALEEAITHLGDCARALDAQERRRAAPLPFAELNALWNALDDRAGLHRPLQAAIVLLARLQRQVDLYAFLHGDPPDVRDLLTRLQSSVGAAATWHEEGNTEARAHARQGLYAAWPLAGVLREMDRAASRDASFSTHPALEEGYRYVSRQSEAPTALRPTLDAAAAERGHSVYRLYRTRIEPLLRLPLAFAVPTEADTAREALQDLRTAVGDLRPALAGGTASGVLGFIRCRDAATRCQDALQALRAALAQTLETTRDFPHIERLRDAVGRVLQGTMTLRHFALAFTQQASQLEALLAQARTAGSGAAPLQYALQTQRQGFERMSRYLQDGQREHLIEGLREIESALPVLRALKRSLPASGARPRGLSDMAPELLVTMTGWRRAIDSGEASAQQVLKAVRSEKTRLEGLLQESRARLTMVLKRHPQPDVQQAAVAYMQNMQQLVGGFEGMAHGLSGGGTGLWLQGFEQARTAIMAMDTQVQSNG